MLNRDKILNQMNAYRYNENPKYLAYYKTLVVTLMGDFERVLNKSESIFGEEPKIYLSTLRMNDAFMYKLPCNQRSQAIEDVTMDFIAKMNNHLIRHPERNNQKHLRIRPYIVIENRNGRSGSVLEHSHSMLILPASIANHPSQSNGENPLQIKANAILRSARPFRTLSDGHNVRLSYDCNSVKIDPLVTGTDIEKALGYILKTAILNDDQNSFAVFDHQSQERFYDGRNQMKIGKKSQSVLPESDLPNKDATF